MENNNGFLYKIRYTGWGRALIFFLIILIGAGTGFASYLKFGQISKEERLDNYINNYLDRQTYQRFGSANNLYYLGQSDLFLDYSIVFGDYKDEDGNVIEGNLPKEVTTHESMDLKEGQSVDDFFNKDDFAFIVKGTMENGEINIEESNIDKKKYGEKIETYLYGFDAIENNITTEDKFISNKEMEEENLTEEDLFEKYTEVIAEEDPELNSIRGYRVTKNVQTFSKIESFTIGLTNENLNNNLFIIKPINNILLYGCLPGLLIMIILFLIYDGFSNYGKYRNRIIIKLFRNTYLEIKLFLLFWLYFFIIAGFLLFLDYHYEVFFTFGTSVNISYYIGLCLMALLAVGTVITIRMTTLYIKEIYNDGFKDSIWNRSLIVKICRYCIKLIKKFIDYISRKVHNIATDVGTLGTLQIALIVIGMASIVIFFSVIFRTGAEGMWFLLGIIAMVVAYRIIYSIVKNIRNLNEKSSEIAKGNYDVKVNEDLPYFKNIAHNFNTIGDNLTTAVEEQVKAERMRTELITNVSHDLKTPLTSIINYSKILIDDEASTEEKLEYAEIIHEKSLKLKTLIEDLFQISKATSNNIEFEKEKLDFSSLTLQAIGEWKDHFEEKGLNIIFTKPEYPLVLELDGNRTYRVLDNLMSNIYKYAQGNTRVYMDLKEKDDNVELTIKNISAYELNISAEELMERFTRGDKSRTTDGSGLGLSIASSLIEGQGGTFNIEIDGDLFKVKIEF